MSAASITHHQQVDDHRIIDDHQIVDDHRLLDPSSPTWSIVESLTLNFAAHLENNHAE